MFLKKFFQEIFVKTNPIVILVKKVAYKDISTMLKSYTDVTKKLRRSEFECLDFYFANEYNIFCKNPRKEASNERYNSN